MKKTYRELSRLESFEDRLEYLYIGDKIGRETFGNARWLNQVFYKSKEWLRVRDQVLVRDYGCDLGIEGCELGKRDAIVHHINPITPEDVINRHPIIFDMDNLVTVSRSSHNYIHYGTVNSKQQTERYPNDTCPWKSERR